MRSSARLSAHSICVSVQAAALRCPLTHWPHTCKRPLIRTPTRDADTQRRPRGNEHTAPRIKARKSSQNPTRQRLQKAHTTDCAETHIKKRVPRKLRTRKADRARFELAEVSLDGFQDRFFRPLRHLSGKSCAGRLSGPIPPHKN